MSYYELQLDGGYSFAVEGFVPAKFTQGDCLEIDDRSKTTTKDRFSIFSTDNVEYRGGFVRFILMKNSPVSGLMCALMSKQRRDMMIKKNHSFSVVITYDGEEEFHLKKCLFNLQISDVKKHYFFIVFEEDALLQTLNDLC